MSSVIVQAFVTLDGVVQSDAGTEENGDAGFEHGNWPIEFNAGRGDDGMTDIVREWESRTEALLLGRRTYDIWASAWGVWDENAEGLDGELTRRYNRVPKYVATRTLTELAWRNSHVLGDDVPGAVARLRAEEGGEIRVWGSTKLIRTLAEHDLIDEYRLAVYPLVLGSGTKLFPDGFATATLALADSRVLPSGVVINVYQRKSGE